MKHLHNFCITFLVLLSYNLESSWSFSDLLHVKCSGEMTNQFFNSGNIKLLNDAIDEDDIDYVLSTFDYVFRADYGKIKSPRISFYTDFRFRYAWGSSAQAQTINNSFVWDDATFNIAPAKLNKHLMWMRTGWLKMMFGSDLEKHKNFFQMGLIPFELGRGISLGAAYDIAGFLGFTLNYSIDQYAPAVILSINPIGDTVFNFYAALLNDDQNSVEDNFAVAHAQEIGHSHRQGIAENTIIVALQNKTVFKNGKKNSITLEPYILSLYAPNKTLEFAQDIDANLSTAGIAIEAIYQKLNWGIECAANFGDVFVKAVDRNQITIVKESDGGLVEQYTKIYDQNPVTVAAKLVDVTNVNQAYVDGSPKNPDENGQEIGPNLFNAYDRFRPAQTINLDGFYVIADVAYDYIPKVLTGALGVAYFSGSPRRRIDMNNMSSAQCMQQSFSGFVPLQSIYSGKRIKHFVMLNQGVPRYTISAALPSFSLINATPSLAPDTINSTTNLAFIGTRLAYNPEKFKKNEMLLAPNIIAYWQPDTGYFTSELLPENSPFLGEIDNFLGTEINLEFSVKVFEYLTIAGYAGMLIPGKYYQDICGTIVKEFNLPISDSIAYICDIAISYAF